MVKTLPFYQVLFIVDCLLVISKRFILFYEIIKTKVI